MYMGQFVPVNVRRYVSRDVDALTGVTVHRTRMGDIPSENGISPNFLFQRLASGFTKGNASDSRTVRPVISVITRSTSSHRPAVGSMPNSIASR